MDAPDAAIDLDADPDLVWDALTDPGGVEAWLGADSHLAPTEGAELDVADIETATPRRGRVDHLEPHRRLTFTWWPEDPIGPATTVDIRLLPLNPGTRVTVTERPTAPGTATASTVRTGRHHWAWRLAAVELTCHRRHLGTTSAHRR